MVRIGTPASFLISKVHGNPAEIGKIIFGGPMMGTSAVNINAPITKLSSGILLFKDDISFKPEETVCIRCGKCVEACPVGLMPLPSPRRFATETIMK